MEEDAQLNGLLVWINPAGVWGFTVECGRLFFPSSLWNKMLSGTNVSLLATNTSVILAREKNSHTSVKDRNGDTRKCNALT